MTWLHTSAGRRRPWSSRISLWPLATSLVSFSRPTAAAAWLSHKESGRPGATWRPSRSGGAVAPRGGRWPA
eukprot:2420818-Alexandrium_andersonii.AAC.1